VRGVIRRAKTCFRPLAERRVVETIAVVPGAIVTRFRIIGDFCQGITEAKLPQDPRCVTADLKAGADLTEGGGLFEQLGGDAALAECQQRGDSANAAARNQNLFVFVGHDDLKPGSREMSPNSGQCSRFSGLPASLAVCSWRTGNSRREVHQGLGSSPRACFARKRSKPKPCRRALVGGAAIFPAGRIASLQARQHVRRRGVGRA